VTDEPTFQLPPWLWQTLTASTLVLIVPIVVWAFDARSRQEMHERRLQQVEAVVDHVSTLDRDLAVIQSELVHIREDQRETRDLLRQMAALNTDR